MSFVDIPASSKRWVSLTPLIDIVFILIMFFMLTTQFERTQVLSVSTSTLGTNSTSEAIENNEIARVRVLNDASWQFNNQQHSLSDGDALAALTGFQYVELIASDDVTLQEVIDLIDEFAKVGINDVLWLPKEDSDAL